MYCGFKGILWHTDSCEDNQQCFSKLYAKCPALSQIDVAWCDLLQARIALCASWIGAPCVKPHTHTHTPLQQVQQHQVQTCRPGRTYLILAIDIGRQTQPGNLGEGRGTCSALTSRYRSEQSFCHQAEKRGSEAGHVSVDCEVWNCPRLCIFMKHAHVILM